METPYFGSQLQAREASQRRVELEPVARTMQQLLGRNRVLIMLPEPIRIGMRDQILRYLLAPTPARFSFGTKLLELDDDTLAIELSQTDYVWIPEVVPEFDRQVATRFSRIGNLRMIKVTRGASLDFIPVDQPEQMEPRQLHGR